MRYLKQNTATRVTVGPFLDVTDAKTPEVALTATNEKVTFVVDDGGVPTLVIDANATASGGNNDLVHITNDDAGYYDLELTAAQTNYVGRAVLSVNYVTDHLPVFHEFMILPANVFDAWMGTDKLDVNAAEVGGTSQTGRDIGASVLLSNGTGTGQVTLTSGRVNADLTHIATAAVNTALAQLGVNLVNISGSAVSATTAQLGVNVVQISSDATAADNLELFMDGTGYAGGAAPLQVVLTTSGKEAVADQVWDENITGHYAVNSAGAMIQPLHSGTCQAGGNSTTVVLASSASSSDDYYNGDLVMGWVAADRTNVFADYISDYTGSTRTATVTGIPVSPDATYSYIIIPGGSIPGATAPSASDVADAVWDEAMTSHVTEGTYGNAIGGEISHEGTLQSAASTSSAVLDATGSSVVNNWYRYQRFEIVAGTGVGLSSYISAYVGASKTITLDPPLAQQPDNTSRYIIRKLGLDASTPGIVADAVWDEVRSGHVTAGSFGEYVNADTVRLSGDATAADNAEAFFDGTGYAGTNNIIPTVTTVSNQVTANVAQISGDSAAADNLEAMLDGTGSVTLTTNITGNVTGNLSGSVGSVTGAVGSVTGNLGGNVTGSVGSVTGNVGGNVVGSVGSVTGAVGSVTGAVGSVTGNVGGNVVGSVASVTAGVTLTNAGIDALFTRQLTESYAADGAAPTVAQSLMLIQQMLGDFEISGTTLTVKRVNGSTTAATFTLNDGTTPTGITRSG